MNCVFIKNVAKLVKIPVITLAEIKTKKFSYHRDGNEMISALLILFPYRTVTKILPCIDFFVYYNSEKRHLFTLRKEVSTKYLKN